MVDMPYNQTKPNQTGTTNPDLNGPGGNENLRIHDTP